MEGAVEWTIPPVPQSMSLSPIYLIIYLFTQYSIYLASYMYIYPCLCTYVYVIPASLSLYEYTCSPIHLLINPPSVQTHPSIQPSTHSSPLSVCFHSSFPLRFFFLPFFSPYFFFHCLSFVFLSFSFTLLWSYAFPGWTFVEIWNGSTMAQIWSASNLKVAMCSD